MPKELKISALGMCDTSNLCGAVEFSDKLSKVGTQPIIGTQINFKFNDTSRFTSIICSRF
jgi:DNA polymerase-3 subunit alpha